MKVTVEELREHLEEVLEKVGQGGEITILSGDRAVAKLGPPDGLVLENVGRPWPLRDFDPGPRPKRLDFDVAQIIIDERNRERSGEKYR